MNGTPVIWPCAFGLVAVVGTGVATAGVASVVEFVVGDEAEQNYIVAGARGTWVASAMDGAPEGPTGPWRGCNGRRGFVVYEFWTAGAVSAHLEADLARNWRLDVSTDEDDSPTKKWTEVGNALRGPHGYVRDLRNKSVERVDLARFLPARRLWVKVGDNTPSKRLGGLVRRMKLTLAYPQNVRLVLAEPRPRPASIVETGRPPIQASRLGEATDTTRRSMKVTIDGIDRTEHARIEANRLICSPPDPLPAGEHIVEIGADGASSLRWRFTSVVLATHFREPLGGVAAPGHSWPRVAVAARVFMSPEDCRRSSLTMTVKTPGEPVTIKAGAAPQTSLAVACPTLPPGNWPVSLELRWADGALLHRIDMSLCQLPPKEEFVAAGPDGNIYLGEQPFFPIGIYYPTIEGLPELAKAGFNLVQYSVFPKEFRMYGVKGDAGEFLETAHRLGLKVYANVRGMTEALGQDRGDNDVVWQRMRMLRAHPALLAWYLLGEPYCGNIAPREAEAWYRRLRTFDPAHPTWGVFASPDYFDWWTKAVDIVATDPYPVDLKHPKLNRPLTMVSDYIDRLRAVAPGPRPLWAVLQIWTNGGQPSSQQARCMVYLALTHGANGILFYRYRPRRNDLWAEVLELAGELKALAPVCLAPDAPQPATCDTPHVHCLLKQADSVYLIAVNASEQPVRATFSLPGQGEGHARVLFNGEKTDIHQGKLRDSFGPLSTRVYRLRRDR